MSSFQVSIMMTAVGVAGWLRLGSRRSKGRSAVFYVLSKVIFPLIAPSNFSLVLIGIGLALRLFERWRRWGGRVALAGFVLLLLVGFSPVGKWLSIPLEARFADVTLPEEDAVTHIIFLGGFEQSVVSLARGQLATNSSGERILYAVSMSRRYPNAKVVFAGGHGWLFGKRLNATQFVTDYMEAVGIAPERIMTEGKSRTTSQNARYVREMLDAEGETCPCGYLLVTSAWHMPRSVGVFRRAGFEGGERRLFPLPVDYRVRGVPDAWSPYSWLHEGLEQSDLAFKEWVGLLAYWLSGRTDALWPGPREARQRAERAVKKEG